MNRSTYLFGKKLTISLRLVAFVGLLFCLLGVLFYRQDFLSGRYPGGQIFQSVDAGLQLIEGKRERKGIYLGTKGRFFRKPVQPDPVALSNSQKSLNEFARDKEDLSFFFAIVPDAAAVYPEALPLFAPVRDQGADIDAFSGGLEGMESIDLMQIFRESKSKELYYKTDPHWSSEGAELAFEVIAKEMSLRGVSKDYTAHIVSKSFTGRLARDFGWSRSSDRIRLYEASNSDIRSLLSYPEKQEKRASLYDSGALKKGHYGYDIFPGSGQALTSVRTSNQNGRVLLMLSDSYGNSLLPFLVPYFEHIYMIHPELFDKDLNVVLEKGGVTDVLFLFGADTIFREQQLFQILKQ